MSARQFQAKPELKQNQLLAILRQIQAQDHVISRQSLAKISEDLNLPLARVQSTAEFYSFLHSRPQGRYEIYFSDCIIDHFAGQEPLMERLSESLNTPVGTTRGDRKVSLHPTACTGLCDQGPALLINGLAIGRLSQDKIEPLVRLIEDEVPLPDWPGNWFQIDDPVHRQDKVLCGHFKPGSALSCGIRMGADRLLEELQRSGLRGRGGAGFPTSLKWRYCRETPGEHFIVCNADEGEPGTFKDRVLLKHHADLVFEGMTLAAYVTGARQGYLYLRGEYLFLLPHLQATLRRRRRQGLLGRNLCALMDFHFEIDIVVGAGAYVCGEESALLESIEGKRGIPRNRPPYPVTRGLFGQPTVVNNVESFAAASRIAIYGGDWFANVGTDQSKGTKLLSISGDCHHPGIYEIPFGSTVAEVLQWCGAGECLGVQVGGPAGTFVHPSEFKRLLAFEDLATGGSFMVFGKHRDMLEIVANFTHFFAHESCGFCTPCRVGTSLLAQMIDKFRRGYGTVGDLMELEQLGQTVRSASHCGLGHTAANPILDTLTRYPEIYQQHSQEIDFSPGFDLDRELEPARKLTGREDANAHLSQQ